MNQSDVNSNSESHTVNAVVSCSSSTSNHSNIATSSNGQYNGGNKSNNEQQNKNRICRDFIRGSCRRLFCKYPHVQSPDQVVFCHDFQNNVCPRINCKFLHYTIDEEEHYRKYGEFPIGQQQQQQQQDEYVNSNNNNNNQNINSINGNHPDYPGDYEYNGNGFFNNSNNNSNGNHPHRNLPSLLDSDLFHPTCQQRIEGGCSIHCINHSDRAFSNGSNSFRNGLKRLGSPQDRDFLQQQQPKFKRCREDEIMAVLRRFEEEHQMLKRRVEANELKIAELRASNEYLLNQNAQLRLSTVQVSRVVNPVTVTNTQSQQQTQTPQVINASMAPVQNPQVINAPIMSIAPPPTQLIATPPVQPLTIHATANTSQAASQILGTSQITLAPAAVGLSINTSQALQAAISNANQPIISYPIMTHSILPH
ncbi:hypothetical protein PVAND_008921 [Polypedilum vanderplanki]|uniref:C3H1-type domain-containing protein n=1 Tax=Polypedilum vanderplanki TaxID=319348 RepID=A0A9J6CCK0_POLVA|nr:hypothetical protein PVAND_008921 [Polypedilum vanderplanki]